MSEVKNEHTIEQFKTFLEEHNFNPKLVNETDYEGTEFKCLSFDFPVARNYETISVYEDDNLDAIMSSDFMKYRGVCDYEAVWSKELNRIECEVQDPRIDGPNRMFLRRVPSDFEMLEEITNEFGKTEPAEILLYANEEIKVTIGYASKEFAFISAYKEGRHLDIGERTSRFRNTLKIENISVETEEKAKNYLEKLSNSLFFQLDVIYGFTITLAPRRISRTERSLRRRRAFRANIEKRELKLNYEYDKTPLSLYWFAQKNIESPIFAFFAFYQVLEYYFPIYSTIEAKNRIKNLFRDPNFSIDSETDMIKLLNVITAKNADSIGDEREQLNNVLRNITTGEEIIEYINSMDFLKEYYTDKKSNKLSDEKLSLSDSNGIISKVSARIYDIRCRIVHNKASEIHKKILPVTQEEDYLRNEIYLLKFLARKSIFVNSKMLHLN